MTYRQALRALDARQENKVRLGLPRVTRCLARLGDPHRKMEALHVAGTNGKGSVCAILDAVLRRAGVKTGLFTSPHLVCVRERIRVGGRPITERAFARALGRVLRRDPERELAYFELMTAAAFQHFADQGVEVAVLETGLGGRLDATNVVERPLATVITSISMDHMEHLGSRLSSIAQEKAGIIKRGVPVVVPKLPAPAMKAILRKAAGQGAPLVLVRRLPKAVGIDWDRNTQRLRFHDGRVRTLRILGACQARNVALARAALAQLGPRFPVSERAWTDGLASVRWPCRFEVRRVSGKRLVIDGAHNVESVERFRRTLDAAPWGKGRVRLILGVLGEKDAAGMVDALGPRLRDVSVCAPRSPRALDPMDLARLVRSRVPKARVTVERHIGPALRSWMGQRSVRTAAVCGSLYLAGEAVEELAGGSVRRLPELLFRERRLRLREHGHGAGSGVDGGRGCKRERNR